MIIVPLTTIKLQLEADCRKLGFSALIGDQVLHDGLGNIHPLRCPPHCELLFLSTSQKTSRGSC